MPETGIIKIEILVGETSIKLSLAEARELRESLNNLFLSDKIMCFGPVNPSIIPITTPNRKNFKEDNFPPVWC